tara:strand:- start:285 stop:482 length:198 start_codon:yes stop_codon:yes gene_type:complete
MKKFFGKNSWSIKWESQIAEFTHNKVYRRHENAPEEKMHQLKTSIRNLQAIEGRCRGVILRWKKY